MSVHEPRFIMNVFSYNGRGQIPSYGSFCHFLLVVKRSDWSNDPEADTGEHWDWSDCVLLGVSHFDS